MAIPIGEQGLGAGHCRQIERAKEVGEQLATGWLKFQINCQIGFPDVEQPQFALPLKIEVGRPRHLLGGAAMDKALGGKAGRSVLAGRLGRLPLAGQG